MRYQMLLYGGKQLWCFDSPASGRVTNTYTLRDFGIARGATVHQLLRVQGAGRSYTVAGRT
eukprot:4671663-Karenia_brevis.AAC.1